MAIAVKIPTDGQPQAEDQPQGEAEDEPQQQQEEDQPQQQVGQTETEIMVAGLGGETGSDILNRLASGQILGSVIDVDDESKVVKEEMEIEMHFDD